MSLNNISIEIPKNIIADGAELKTNELNIPDELKDKFGSGSVYYDIYLENNSERLNIKSDESIKINIKLENMKEFIGVYEIADNNIIKPVEYRKNGKNVEIITKTIGKYVVSYKEIKAISPEITVPVPKIENKKQSNDLWITLITSLIILSGTIYVCNKKKN